MTAAAPPSTSLAPIRWAPYVFVPIWATGFIAARLAMPHMTPQRFLAWRFGLSALAFLIWIALARPGLPRARDGTIDRRSLAWLAVTGVLMHAGYLGGVWTAVRWGMGAGLVALLVGLQPILTAAWMTVHQRERHGWSGWLGLAAGFGGVALAVGHKLGVGEVHAASLAAALFALASITVGTLLQKARVGPVDFRIAQAVQIGASLPVAAWLSTFEHGGPGPDPRTWHPDLWIALGWSVFGLTLGGSSLLFALVARGAATRVTSLLYLVPPMTAAIAWAMFGEALGWGVLGGFLLTALGVWLVHRPVRR